MLADMHTHSENSHDSVCSIEDMLLSEIENGTEIFAVTDHFDTDSYNQYDIFSPIRKASEAVEELNRKYSGKISALSGIEISEGFWHPGVLNRVYTLADFDVIIGSVHLVKYKNLTSAASTIDFSSLPKETVEEYLDSYFNDVLTMLKTVDFDILAHLTYPLRYINGKYGVDISLNRYQEKIERILKGIIEKNVALEINTSSFSLLGEFMPTTDIIKKYVSLGGKLITLGSDAHVKENASAHFSCATDFLKEIRINEIYYYKKRKPISIKI